MSAPRLAFLSLFVPDLDQAVGVYRGVLQAEPETARAPVPTRHPFSPRPPAVFDLGGVKLALFQVDQRTTHAGDVGIGLVTDAPLAELTERVAQAGGQTFFGPAAPAGAAAELAIFALPDRHFFEAVARGQVADQPA